MIKKLMIILFTFVIIICTAPKAHANYINIVCNGEVLNTDVEPMVVGNSVFVPVGNICRSIGAKVNWNEQNKMASITFAKNTVSIFVGSTYMERNGVPLLNSDVSFINNERIMVPLRTLSSHLDLTIEWDSLSNTAYVLAPKSVFYKFDDANTLTFSSKYNSSQDIAITFCPMGANNLPDFYKFYLVYNTGNFPKNDLSDSFCLYTSTSDWHSGN